MAKIIKCRQRSAYWFHIRSKKLTASKAQAIGNNGSGLETYVKEMLEIYYGLKERPVFSNEHTERGIALEGSAKFLYEMKTGLTCCNPGFVVIDEYTGFSPDFLSLVPLAGAEFKCPTIEIHEKNLSGKVPSAYDWQCQFSMMGCNLNVWNFVSYNPDHENEMIIIPVERNENMIDKLRHGIKTGIRLIEMYDEEFSKTNIITV